MNYKIILILGQDSSSDITSGVYIYQLMVSNEQNIPVFSDIRKMIHIK